jgi:hypothetical protein
VYHVRQATAKRHGQASASNRLWTLDSHCRIVYHARQATQTSRARIKMSKKNQTGPPHIIHIRYNDGDKETVSFDGKFPVLQEIVYKTRGMQYINEIVSSNGKVIYEANQKDQDC